MIPMANREEDPTQVLLEAMRHPLRVALLRRYLEADEPLGTKRLAESIRQPLSSVRYHVRKLAELGAIEIVEEEQRRGAVARFHEPTPLLKETPWALSALGLSSPRDESRRLSDEERAAIDAHIAERRKDTEFMDRLRRRAQENAPILERLNENAP
ncbi:MAG: hypothetical protein ACTHN3_11325 [Solirubrobacterales bacterium]